MEFFRPCWSELRHNGLSSQTDHFSATDIAPKMTAAGAAVISIITG
jgi:hypothetical protein